MPSFSGCAKVMGTISLGLLTGALATNSFITVPAVVAIASRGDDANAPFNLVRQRVNMMTVVCGTLSVSTLSLAFLFGAKHGYLVYASAVSAILLRNQQEAFLNIKQWAISQYEVTKEVIQEYYARKRSRRTARQFRTNVKRTQEYYQGMFSATAPSLLFSPNKVTSELEKLGASSLTNCAVSGIAFIIVSIGVLGDME